MMSLAASSLLATSACAQESADAIQPDRPDVTNGTRIVPTGIVQVVFGGLYMRTGPSATGAVRR